ncbi:hypothetical protein AGMMS50284_2330 [Clostridia bacterium]|nr:hypothetical protein AGMMS50284_2330 [Clostridia bacterium]
MFVTKKITKNKMIAAAIILVLLVFLIFRFTACGFTKNTADSPIIGTYILIANDNQSCVDFLTQFDFKVAENPVEVTNVRIPAEFNDTFIGYNDLQKAQGLDLEPYKGKECERRSYKILNYNSDDEVVANLLIYNEMVIGGDVSAMAQDGFMTTFDDKR